MNLSDDELLALREQILPYMDERRYRHTLGVEQTAAELGALILPDSVPQLRAAALLHDIAKCATPQRVAELQAQLPLTEEDLRSPAVLHAYYAPLVIRQEFPRFATDAILSAVERHTLGAEGMTPFDEIIFLADYIEPGRTYESCRLLREQTLTGLSDLSADGRLLHLHRMALAEAELVIRYCQTRGETLHTRLLRTADFLHRQIQAASF